MDKRLEGLERRLDALQEVQMLVSYRLFEGLLATDAKAAKTALAQLAEHASDLDQANEHEKAVADHLATQVRLFRQAVALRASAAEVHVALARAKSDKSGSA